MTNTVHVNVSGTWKTASNYYVNVGGTWKTGSDIYPNVSTNWKGYIPTVLSTNLKLHLDAGDSSSYGGSGTTWTDLTSEDNDGTISGATHSNSDGGIFDFDGTDDYISIPDDASIEPTNVDWTFEAWINVDSGAAGDYNCILSKNAPIQVYWYDNKIMAWFSAADNTGSYFVTGINSGSNSLTTGGWHHVVISRASNVWKIYIDKVEKYSNTHNGTVYDGTATAYIGNYGGSSYFFNGKIAQVRIYQGTGLTAAQVTQNYDATKSTFGL
tara:strand:- start:8274 stop:9080 length:807 start_codon:yes stop_codon:yes gene_type:complete